MEFREMWTFGSAAGLRQSDGVPASMDCNCSPSAPKWRIPERSRLNRLFMQNVPQKDEGVDVPQARNPLRELLDN